MQTTVVDEAVVSDDGIITSRGPGTALDFALALVVELAGADVRNEVEAALKRDKATA
jgi:4-methyl-5(b-hydroxyethyl)-thiazole monophosphate biosynthesis